MRYTIISIDDSRDVKKKDIREALADWPEETGIPFVNGRDLSNIDQFLEDNPLVRPPYGWALRGGEWGVLASQINCWKWIADSNEPLLIFEDDAMLHRRFVKTFDVWLSHTPKDWDVFAVFVPENQKPDFYYDVTFDENGTPSFGTKTYKDGNPDFFVNDIVSRAYQGYSCVSLAISPNGARKLLSRLHTKGVHGPVDCFIFEQARGKHINAYAPRPPFQNVVGIDWRAPTTIHDSDHYIADERRPLT